MDKTPNEYKVFLICAVLAVATFIVYGQVSQNEFINYDVTTYITGEPHINGGITLQSVIWAFTTPHACMWQPLTSISHMLDCQLFGLNPFWHHIVNLLLHTANTLLLFWVLQRMTGAVWPSAFVAAVFGLHPLNVESVAWLAERKNVLCGFFWMLTMAAYVRYTERPGVRRYLLVVLAFCLGLMSKPMIVTLPFVLLLLDYWPLGQKGRSAWRLIYEKVPLLILSAIGSGITFIAQQNKGAMIGVEKLSVGFRIVNAAVSYISYINKLIYPSQLAAIYPISGITLGQIVTAVVLLTIVSVWIIRLTGFGRLTTGGFGSFDKLRINKLTTGGGHKYLLVGWLWYLGTLVPMIGLVQVGSQARADRYMYISMIGLLIIIAWGWAEIVAEWHLQKFVSVFPAVGCLLALAICTWLQVGYWHDSMKLFNRCLEVSPDNYLANYYIGDQLDEQGKTDEAIAHFRKAIEVRGGFVEVVTSLAIALYHKGSFDEAVQYLDKVIKCRPNDVIAHRWLGLVLARQGKTDQAIEEFRITLGARPADAEIHYNLGILLSQKGRIDQAIEEFRTALSLSPGYSAAGRQLEAALAQKKRNSTPR